jgi:uncharacterized membrane protein
MKILYAAGYVFSEMSCNSHVIQVHFLFFIIKLTVILQPIKETLLDFFTEKQIRFVFRKLELCLFFSVVTCINWFIVHSKNVHELASENVLC